MGRGRGALLPQRISARGTPPPDSGGLQTSGPVAGLGQGIALSETFEFELVPIERLRAHEQYVEADVQALLRQIRNKGEFDNPIWVAKGSYVILNGHHRVEALRKLGLKRIPAWVFDYQGDHVALGRWRPGPPIAKTEVVQRAHRGRPFPPKTTRHRLRVELPPRTAPLEQLAT